MKCLKHCGPDPKPMTEPEALALAEACKTLPPNPTIVQIGAYIGVSTMAMIEARPDAFIFSIDLKPHPEETQNLLDEGLDYTRAVRLLGDSASIGKHWPHKVDLVYIDGDHRYSGVKADCEMWLSKTKRVIFHDYVIDNPPPKNQVYEVVNEMVFREPFMQVERLIGFEL